MTDLFSAADDATLLDPDETKALRQSWIITRAHLNEAEQANITTALQWARRRRKRDVLSAEFVRTLHKAMFGDVWAWAGKYRTTSRNIGVDAYRIPTEVVAIIEDARFWVDNQTFIPDEIAVRTHHRLVFVHPFPNGNGRHGRLFADLLGEQLGRQPFTWGRERIENAGSVRSAYINALRNADRHDYEALLAFVRS